MGDWATLVAAAGVSAIVSAIVSLLAVRQVTVRRSRAERADAAMQRIRAIVEPLLDALSRYEYVRPPEPRRIAERSHMDDHAAVVRIRHAAADLPLWRRALVDRRCRRVFGDYWTNLAIDYPNASSDEAGASFSAWLAASVRGRQEDDPGPVDGLIHRAYSEPAGRPVQNDLRRELRRLSAAR